MGRAEGWQPSQGGGGEGRGESYGGGHQRSKCSDARKDPTTGGQEPSIHPSIHPSSSQPKTGTQGPEEAASRETKSKAKSPEKTESPEKTKPNEEAERGDEGWARRYLEEEDHQPEGEG